MTANDNDDRAAALGGNAAEVLKDRVQRRLEVMADIDVLKEQLGDFKKEDKSDGFDEKAIAQAVKERRKGARFSLAQLSLELIVNTYRAAVGLPTTVEDAQKLAAQEAKDVPEPKRAADKKRRARAMN